MSWSTIVLIFALGGSCIAASLMQGHASRLLTSDQNNQVVTLRALRRTSRTLLPIYVGVAFAALSALGVFKLPISFYILVLLAASAAAWAHVTYFRKLRALGLPPEYLSAVSRSRMVVYCGLFIVLAVFMYEEMRSR
jgi:small-conductance mechanosensitive channel